MTNEYGVTLDRSGYAPSIVQDIEGCYYCAARCGKLDAEFGFTCDVCATADNAKCAEFYSPEQDGLAQEWTGVCWCNPPYGREIGKWVRKAAESSCTVVMLLPARTDTKWFHDYIYGKAEIRFIRGRLKFGAAKNSASFPSMIVIFNRESEKG